MAFDESKDKTIGGDDKMFTHDLKDLLVALRILADEQRKGMILLRGQVAGLQGLLTEAADYEREAFDDDEDVNGGDLVEWFAEWRQGVIEALPTVKVTP